MLGCEQQPAPLTTNLICEGLPASERTHVRLLFSCRLNFTCDQSSLSSPLCQHAAVGASCLCISHIYLSAIRPKESPQDVSMLCP